MIYVGDKLILDGKAFIDGGSGTLRKITIPGITSLEELTNVPINIKSNETVNSSSIQLQVNDLESRYILFPNSLYEDSYAEVGQYTAPYYAPVIIANMTYTVVYNGSYFLAQNYLDFGESKTLRKFYNSFNTISAIYVEDEVDLQTDITDYVATSAGWAGFDNINIHTVLVLGTSRAPILNLKSSSTVLTDDDGDEHTIDQLYIKFVNVEGTITSFSISRDESTDLIYYGDQGGVITGSACLDEDTLIYTKTAFKPIKEISVGDLVYSLNKETNDIELKKVNNIVSHKSKKVYMITTERENLIATYDHLFYLANGDIVKTEDLVVGNTLINRLKLKDNIIGIVKLNKVHTVYDISVEDNYNYFAGNSSILVATEDVTKA